MRSIEELEDKLREHSDILLAAHDKSEKIAWIKNPVTQAWLEQLKADYLHGLLDFAHGVFIDTTIDKTAAEATALHVRVQALGDLIQSIEEMKDEGEEPETETGEQSNTY